MTNSSTYAMQHHSFPLSFLSNQSRLSSNASSPSSFTIYLTSSTVFLAQILSHPIFSALNLCHFSLSNRCITLPKQKYKQCRKKNLENDRKKASECKFLIIKSKENKSKNKKTKQNTRKQKIKKKKTETERIKRKISSKQHFSLWNVLLQTFWFSVVIAVLVYDSGNDVYFVISAPNLHHIVLFFFFFFFFFWPTDFSAMAMLKLIENGHKFFFFSFSFCLFRKRKNWKKNRFFYIPICHYTINEH